MTSNAKKVIKITVLSVFFILIIFYAFFISRDLIFGVKVKNININGESLISGSTITSEVVKITGNAKNAIKLTLNGREISIDEQGNWNETIILLTGYNTINIKAQDKFGSVDEKDYQLMYVKL